MATFDNAKLWITEHGTLAWSVDMHTKIDPAIARELIFRRSVALANAHIAALTEPMAMDADGLRAAAAMIHAAALALANGGQLMDLDIFTASQLDGLRVTCEPGEDRRVAATMHFAGALADVEGRGTVEE